MYGLSVLFRNRVVSLISVRYKNNSSKKLLEFLATMPKANSARIVEAQRQRQQISKKGEKYAPSTVYLQVLGSGARGVPNTVYLFTDTKRYLFNCGECTQRLAHEHKVRLSRLDHIFITGKTWKNIGGLPGLSLTLQDVGVPNITLHGPEGLDELYNATRRFVTMKDMNVTMAKCSPSEDFEDSVMTVKYVLLGPHDNLLVNKEMKPAAKRPRLGSSSDKEFEEFIHDDTDYYKREVLTAENLRKNINVKDKTYLKNGDKADSQETKTEKVLHDLQKKTNCTVAYICTLKKRLGALDLAKCVELGVKPGPMLGQLKSGHDVLLPCGKLVLAKDVKMPDDPGPVFIVLDVPELSYLKESEFSAHFDDGSNPPEKVPAIIVHYTPPDVFNHPTYRSFMALFGPTTRHLVLNSQNSCLGSEAVHRAQHKLHLLDPGIFPLLRDASVPAVWRAPSPPAAGLDGLDGLDAVKGMEELKDKIALAQFQNIINMEGSSKADEAHAHDDSKLDIIAGRTLTMFHLRPKKQLDRSAELKLNVQDYIQETMDVDGFVDSLEQFRRQVQSIRQSRTDAKEFPKVVFLGTGSCIPSKTRNTSGIALQVDENRSMLLDCGEGTFGQLVRFYGTKRVSSFLRTLKAIYISHLHADHHIGLIGVILARRRAILEANPDATPEPLYLLAPGQIFTWLSVYDQQFERIRGDFTLIPNQSLLPNVVSQSTEVTAAVLANMGVEAIRTCLVSHCPNAFGVAIDLGAQNRLTYSGDTIPCQELVKIGENSTILIHEATMEDELEDEARVKMHSTTSQAIDIGRQMNARHTVLTHFSQRYARLPRLSATVLNDTKHVGIAFDNMQLTMSDLELLPHMYAPLQLMFAEHCAEMEVKAAHRARQRRRAASLTAEKSIVQCIRSGSGKRKIPPGCVASAPASRANYMESYSSRLRQESKGMSITGIVRKSVVPVTTNHSKSPSAKEAYSKYVHKPNSRVVTPIYRGRSVSPNKSGAVNTQERGKVPSGYVVETRSNKPANPNEKPSSLDKKLTIMINTPKFTSEFKVPNSTIVCNAKSPARNSMWRTFKEVPGNKLRTTSLLTGKPDDKIGLARTTTLLRNKMRGSSTYTILTNNRKISIRPENHSPNRKTNKTRILAATQKINTPHNVTKMDKKENIPCPKSFTNPRWSIAGPRSPTPSPQRKKENLISTKFLNYKNELVSVHKPKQFNDELRKTQLAEIKKKYQSKHFRNDSRYDKVEGLNWISWK